MGMFMEGRINRSPSPAFLLQGINSMKVQIQYFNLSEFLSHSFGVSASFNSADTHLWEPWNCKT